MNKREEEYEFSWLDNPNLVTDIIIALIAFIVILSQSFAVNNSMTTFAIISNVVNHNSIYLMSLIYFILLKTSFGKKYFNYLNLFLIVFYLIISITSFLTLFQSFSLLKIITLIMNVSIFTYLFHTLLRGTKVWKEFGLSKSIFNEITNDIYFYEIVVLSVILLALNLINTTSFGGAILTMLDTIYIIMFSRYVYLFGIYLDEKSSKSSVNLDAVKDVVEKKVAEIVDKAEDVVKSTAKKSTTKKSMAKKTSVKKTIKKGDK